MGLTAVRKQRLRAPRGRAARASLALAAALAVSACAGQDPDMQAGHVGHEAESRYWSSVSGATVPSGGQTRTYFVSADRVTWDYAPSGRNQVTGRRFGEAAKVFTDPGPGRIGSRYEKCVYRGYADAGFDHLEKRPPPDRYLGVLGPVIRAEVGDTIKVVFRNTCPFPASVHPHGVFYDKDSEGAPYDDRAKGDSADDAVPPGGRHTYTWKVPERAGPGPHDGSSVMWMYHSHTDEVADGYAGLMGPMVVTREGAAKSDGSPTDVDRELFMLFFVDDETKSPLLRSNMRRFGTSPMPSDPEDDDELVEHNLKHSINGYLYGNMPMPTIRRGQHVRWYVMSMGTEVDLHTPHWHGNVVTVDGMRMDVVDLLPASMAIGDMVPDNPGVWLFHCHVNDHIAAGMQARYRVL